MTAPSDTPEPQPGPSFQRILSHISDRWPVERWRHHGCLVAVSGGADSVALLRALTHLKRLHGGSGRLVVGHIDHGVRPTSADDAHWVQQLSRQCDVECVVRKIANQAKTQGSPDSHPAPATLGAAAADEATLRRHRYDQLLQIARENGLRYLATAHHADDQLETVLFRIFRGTGIQGLQGIPFQRVVGDVTIVRPLLDVRRADLNQALAELDQTYRVDPTNAVDDYTRNFLRNQLIPLIESRFPAWEPSVLRLSQQATQWTAALARKADALRQSAVRRTPRGWELDLGKLREVDAFELQFLLQTLWDDAGWPRGDMNHAAWTRVLALFTAATPVPAFTLPGRITATRTDTHVVLRR